MRYNVEKPFSFFYEQPRRYNQTSVSNINKFSYRLRARTDNQLIPPDIRGIVPSGFSRSPRLRILECEAKIQDVVINGKPQKAKDVMTWLDEMSESPYLVHVKSKYEQFNDFDAVLQMPTSYALKALPERDMVAFTLLVV
jgi:hypothetical protein